MGAYDSFLNDLINKNKDLYSEHPRLKWLNYYEAELFQEKRDLLLSNSNLNSLFKDTKPYYKDISTDVNSAALVFGVACLLPGNVMLHVFIARRRNSMTNRHRRRG